MFIFLKLLCRIFNASFKICDFPTVYFFVESLEYLITNLIYLHLQFIFQINITSVGYKFPAVTTFVRFKHSWIENSSRWCQQIGLIPLCIEKACSWNTTFVETVAEFACTRRFLQQKCAFLKPFSMSFLWRGIFYTCCLLPCRKASFAESCWSNSQ